MRIGVFCDDPRARGLIQRLAETGAHELSFGPRDVPLNELAPRDWDQLLLDPALDAVLLGGGAAQAVAAARRLIELDKPVLLWPQAALGLMGAYELSLLLEERPAVFVPAFLHRWQSFDELRAQAPQVQYVELQRTLSAAGGELDAAQVAEFLLSDLDLIAWQFGRYTRVTALRSGGGDQRLRTQTVTLAGERVPEVLWTAQPGAEHGATLTVHTPAGAMRYRWRADRGWRLEALASAPEAGAPVEVDVAQAFARLMRRVAGSAPDWSAAVTAYELLDAVDQSLERRRTVEVHREPVSERVIFKSQMAAWGCGLLLATLALLLGYLALASLVPLPRNVLIVLRVLVFAPLFVFLLAQLLLPLARPAASPGSSCATEPEGAQESARGGAQRGA